MIEQPEGSDPMGSQPVAHQAVPDFTEVSTFIVRQLPKLLEEFLGLRSPLEHPDKAELKDTLNSLFSVITSEATRLEDPHVAPTEKVASILRLIDATARMLPLRIPRGQNAIHWLFSLTDELLRAPVPTEFRHTAYQRHVKSLTRLVSRIWQSGRVARAVELL